MEKSAKSLWMSLDGQRQASLDRARECAKLTIPSLLPPSGHNETSTLPTPYQSLGARGVTHLAAKLVMALVPPNQPFFRLSPDQQLIEKLQQMGAEEGVKQDVQEHLAGIERRIVNKIDASNIRTALFSALRLLVATGDALLHITKDSKAKVFRLDQYVVRRDMTGTVMDIVVKEVVSSKVLPEKVIRACDVSEGADGHEDVDVYTHIYLDDNQWRAYQEINETRVPGTDSSYPKDKPAWIPLRWSEIPGEHYGRGLVEELLGDLKSLEGLSKAIVRSAAVAAKVLFLVDPNGVTKARLVSKAVSGDMVPGRRQDISVLQLDKYADMRVARESLDTIANRLSQSFLLHSVVQRDAERVTAAEVQYVAKELEAALGGVYSVLGQEFQLPLVRRVMALMQRNGELNDLPDGTAEVAVTTGLQALGRGNDLDKLNLYLASMAQAAQSAEALRLDMDDLSKRIASAVGIDPRGLIQPAMSQEQQMLMQLIQQAGPQVIQQVTQFLLQQQQGGTPNGSSQAQQPGPGQPPGRQ